VRSFAAGIAARGFAKGDTFATYMHNAPEYAIAFHGVVAAGGRCTTANPLYTARELGHQLADCGATMLLTAQPFLDVAREAARQVGDCEVFVLGETDADAVGDDGGTPFLALLGDPEAAPEVAIDPVVDIAAIPYSSGTTGLNKGVMLSHRNLVVNMVQSEGVLAVSPEDDEELTAFVAEQVAPHKRIRAIELVHEILVHEIPKSPSGKILRRLLRERERVL
jgi:acyl-CoA synthetase (AMP-forming)/AMP-acid ligase II